MADVPPSVPGDDKDWTWVLERPCPECGFEAGAFDPRAVPAALRANAEEWVALLGGDEVALRRRPDPDGWSPLEYACHVRDVCRIHHERLALMLTTDGPHHPNRDQDATAVETATTWPNRALSPHSSPPTPLDSPPCSRPSATTPGHAPASAATARRSRSTPSPAT